MEEKGNCEVFHNFVENSTITKKRVSIILGIPLERTETG